MRTQVIGAVIALALIMGLTVPAGAVERPTPKLDVAASFVMPPVEINPVTVRFGLYIYFTWNKYEVRNLVNKYGWVYPGVAAMLANACGTFAGVARWACRGVVAAWSWTVWQNFVKAAKLGYCVRLAVGYNLQVRALYPIAPWNTGAC